MEVLKGILFTSEVNQSYNMGALTLSSILQFEWNTGAFSPLVCFVKEGDNSNCTKAYYSGSKLAVVV